MSDGGGDPLAGQRLEQIQTLHVLQEVVEHDEVEAVVAQDDDGVGTGAAARDLMAGSLQTSADEQLLVFIVFDEEQPQRFGHGTIPPQPDSPRLAGGAAQNSGNPGAIGSCARMVTRTPSPGSDAMRTVPRHPVTICRTQISPRPGPLPGSPASFVRIWPSWHSVMPRPLSRMCISIPPISSRRRQSPEPGTDRRRPPETHCVAADAPLDTEERDSS